MSISYSTEIWQRRTWWSQSLTIGVYSIMVYDYFLTLPDEVSMVPCRFACIPLNSFLLKIEYMWKRKFTPCKHYMTTPIHCNLFSILNRYPSFLSLHNSTSTTHDCLAKRIRPDLEQRYRRDTTLSQWFLWPWHVRNFTTKLSSNSTDILTCRCGDRIYIALVSPLFKGGVSPFSYRHEVWKRF